MVQRICEINCVIHLYNTCTWSISSSVEMAPNDHLSKSADLFSSNKLTQSVNFSENLVHCSSYLYISKYYCLHAATHQVDSTSRNPNLWWHWQLLWWQVHEGSMVFRLHVIVGTLGVTHRWTSCIKYMCITGFPGTSQSTKKGH